MSREASVACMFYRLIYSTVYRRKILFPESGVSIGSRALIISYFVVS